MKMRHRIYAVLIVLTFCAAFSLTLGFAAPTEKSLVQTRLLEITGIYTAEEAELAQNEREITRAEAARYALLLTGVHKSSFEGMYEENYYDVTAEHPFAGAITMAQSMNIISSAQQFQPDEIVTVNQMLRMVVSALGYEAYAQLNGGYPTGYLQVANSNGILKGCEHRGENALTGRDMTILLNNALHARIMLQTASGDKIDFQTRKNLSVLNHVFHIYDGIGQITQNDVTALNATEALADGKIRVGEHICKAADDISAILTQYLGYEGTYYIKEENDDKTLVLFLPDRASVTTIFSEDFLDFSGNTLRYFSDGNKRSKRIAADAVILYNGKAVTEPFDMTLFESEWGEIRIVDNQSEPDVLVISSYKNYVVSAIDKENFIIYDDGQEDGKLDFKEDNALSKHARFRSKTGESLTFDKITEGMVLTVAVSPEHDFFDIIAVNETVSGKLESVRKEQKDGESCPVEIAIDGNVYKLAPNLYHRHLIQLIPGNTYSFGLDAGGRIASVKAKRNVSGGYVFLIDAIESAETFDSKIKFRILDGNGRVVVLDSAKFVTVDGERYKESSRIIDILSQDGAVRSQAVEIAVNDDAQITEIDTSLIGKNEDEKDSLQLIYNENEQLRYKSTPKTFSSNFGVSSATKVFFYPPGTETAKQKGTDEQYGVDSIGYFRNDDTYTLQAYAREKDSPHAEIITVTGSRTAAVVAQEHIMVIETVETALDKEGRETKMLSGYYRGAATHLFVKNESVLSVSANTGKMTEVSDEPLVQIEEGDTIRFGQDMEEYVNEIELVYDYSETRAYVDNEDMDQHKVYQVYCSPLYAKRDGFLTLCKDRTLTPSASENPKRHFTANGYNIYVVERTGRSGVKVRIGNLADARDYYTYHEDCSTIVLQQRYYDPRNMVIYQK